MERITDKQFECKESSFSVKAWSSPEYVKKETRRRKRTDSEEFVPFYFEPPFSFKY